MTNIQLYRNITFTMIPQYSFESLTNEVRQVNCHRGLKWVSMIEAHNQKQLEINRLQFLQLQIEDVNKDSQIKQIISKFVQHTSKAEEFLQICTLNTVMLQDIKQFERDKVSMEEEKSHYQEMKQQQKQFIIQTEEVYIPLIENKNVICYAISRDKLIISHCLCENINLLYLYDFKLAKPSIQVIEQQEKITALSIFSPGIENDEYLVLAKSITNSCTLYQIGTLMKTTVTFMHCFENNIQHIILLGKSGQIVVLNTSNLLQLWYIRDQELILQKEIQLSSQIVINLEYNQESKSIIGIQMYIWIVNYSDSVIVYQQNGDNLELMDQIKQSFFCHTKSCLISTIDSVIFVNNKEEISLYDNKTAQINQITIPVKVRIQILLYLDDQDKLVFGDVQGNLYYIDKIQNYFR